MFVGVDIGTSVTKAAAFDDAGRSLGVAGESTRLLRPADGWYEQDIDETIRSVGIVVRRLMADLEAGDLGGASRAGTAEVRLLALTGQGDGVWPTDTAGRAVRPAISWMDGRSGPIVQRWLDDGVVGELFDRNGGVIFAGCPAPILAWLAEHEPETLERTATAGYCKDAVLRRLTGIRATDPTDASLPFLDHRTGDYDPGLLALCGLADHADRLAPIVGPLPTGRLTVDGAETVGLPVGTPVTSGPFDLPASARGSDVSRPGDGHLIVGTTLACQVAAASPDHPGEPAGLTIALGGSRWLRAMPTMVGTAALDWVLRLVGEPHDRVDTLLAESPPGARGVECLPYFSASGERAPFIDTAARARFDRLTVDVTAADLVRSTCEAIAHAGRHCLERAGLDTRGEVAVCGGGTRSAGWMRVFADVLGRPVRVVGQPEAGAWGAVLSGVGALELDRDDSAVRSGDTTVQPDQALTSHYSARHHDYLSLVARARAEWGERGFAPP